MGEGQPSPQEADTGHLEELTCASEAGGPLGEGGKGQVRRRGCTPQLLKGLGHPDSRCHWDTKEKTHLCWGDLILLTLKPNPVRQILGAH